MSHANASDSGAPRAAQAASVRRPSLLTGLRKSAPVDAAPSVDATLRRALANRLIAEQPRAVVGHIGVLAVVTALLWSQAPHGALLLYAGAIVVTATARGLAWLQVRTSSVPEAQLTLVRLVTTAVAFAWGVGVSTLIPHLAPEYLALLLLAYCGLAAGATGTLAADLISFRLFAFCILSPLPVIILLEGHDRFYIAAASLVVLFGIFTLQLHLQSYRDLVKGLRDAAELGHNYRDSRREHLFLDALFASVPNGIAVVDPTGICLSANAGFIALFGYPIEELLGHSLIDLLVPLSGLDETARHLQHLMDGGAVTTETQRRRKDGTLVTVRISAAQVAGDEEGRLLLLYTDITEIRDTEAAMRAAQTRLEMLLSSSTAILYAVRVVGTDFIPSWISDNLTRITGYHVEEALTRDWWYAHLHPEDSARVIAELPRLLAEGQLATEYRFQQKDGRFSWMRDESRLIRDADGLPKEVIGTWLDITDLKLAEATMREGRDLAERSARSRSEFLANMSHEIRTPMNAVLGLTELVLDSELTAGQRRSLRLVQGAGETLLTLLNDILDLSKIEAEHLTLESIPFDLRYLVESTASLLAVRAIDRPVDLMADVANDVPHLILGDPTRLRQVLNNLVGNALKFTEQGEVVLSATAASLSAVQCVIRFAVRDTGIGIPLDKQAAVFDKFTQADASMTRKYGGTGLGLAIARRLVGLMGGEISLTSAIGRGSEFAFSLAFPIEAERPTAPQGTVELAGQRILVVDDNATNRRIVCEMLRPAQVMVDEAASAREGLEALRRACQQGHPYGLALLDAQMPDQDGFELAVKIHSDPLITHTVRLLMLTSAGQRGDTQHCRDVGIEGYLMKPISRSDLLEAIVALLGSGEYAPRVEVLTRHSMAESRPRMRILLAEDNPVNQEVAATMLRRRGHNVTVVNNGREAVDAVAAGTSFDLVLMDIQMPELDGFAATRAIREGDVGATLPIIALTAHALSGERERCLAQGMNGYVPKPFRPHELFAAVEAFGTEAPVTGAAAVIAAPETAPAAPEAVDLVAFESAMREAGAEDAVNGILDLFSENAPERLEALAVAVGAGDGPAIEHAAHAFKSPAGAIGAHGLQALLGEVELSATAGAIAEARATFVRVGPETESVLQYLRVHRGKDAQRD